MKTVRHFGCGLWRCVRCGDEFDVSPTEGVCPFCRMRALCSRPTPEADAPVARGFTCSEDPYEHARKDDVGAVSDTGRGHG